MCFYTWRQYACVEDRKAVLVAAVEINLWLCRNTRFSVIFQSSCTFVLPFKLCILSKMFLLPSRHHFFISCKHLFMATHTRSLTLWLSLLISMGRCGKIAVPCYSGPLHWGYFLHCPSSVVAKTVRGKTGLLSEKGILLVTSQVFSVWLFVFIKEACATALHAYFRKKGKKKFLWNWQGFPSSCQFH